MKESTSKTVEEYIRSHPQIKSCLKGDLINLSSLARQITEELKLTNKTSFDATLIAIRRFNEKLSKEKVNDKKIGDLLRKSSLEIKSKISIFTLQKATPLDRIDKLQEVLRKENCTFYVLEGSDNYTLIMDDRFASEAETKLVHYIIKLHRGLSMLNIKSPKDIQQIPGVLAYLTNIFSENGINIMEFMSCWTDTLFIIDSKDLGKAITLFDKPLLE